MNLFHFSQNAQRRKNRVDEEDEEGDDSEAEQHIGEEPNSVEEAAKRAERVKAMKQRMARTRRAHNRPQKRMDFWEEII